MGWYETAPMAMGSEVARPEPAGKMVGTGWIDSGKAAVSRFRRTGLPFLALYCA